MLENEQQKGLNNENDGLNQAPEQGQQPPNEGEGNSNGVAVEVDKNISLSETVKNPDKVRQMEEVLEKNRQQVKMGEVGGDTGGVNEGGIINSSIEEEDDAMGVRMDPFARADKEKALNDFNKVTTERVSGESENRQMPSPNQSMSKESPEVNINNQQQPVSLEKPTNNNPPATQDTIQSSEVTENNIQESQQTPPQQQVPQFQQQNIQAPQASQVNQQQNVQVPEQQVEPQNIEPQNVEPQTQAGQVTLDADPLLAKEESLVDEAELETEAKKDTVLDLSSYVDQSQGNQNKNGQ